VANHFCVVPAKAKTERQPNWWKAGRPIVAVARQQADAVRIAPHYPAKSPVSVTAGLRVDCQDWHPAIAKPSIRRARTAAC
jgi:hypothetical protein